LNFAILINFSERNIAVLNLSVDFTVVMDKHGYYGAINMSYNVFE